MINLIDKLLKVDWNFPEKKYSKGIHDIHPYPAKFIPEIPRNLMKNLKIPANSGVLDPFCGSGVTLVEAQRMGLSSVGVDLNPIACLISYVKTTPTPNNFLLSVEQCIKSARLNKNIEIPNIPNLDHWFEKPVQQALSALTFEINKIGSDNIKNRLKVALSSIIVKVSNQDSDTRYAAIKKDVSYEKVFEYFNFACEGIYNNCNSIRRPPKARIINKDILDVKPKEIRLPIGMVITSPPYPNAYEYWLYHKYRMYWLGYDPISVKNSEIGARAHFFKKEHHTKKDFENQMEKTFSLLKSVIVPKAFICFVVGRSIIHGNIIDNASIIEDIAHKKKLTHIVTIPRSINMSRKSFNLSYGKIKKEEILIFQNI